MIEKHHILLILASKWQYRNNFPLQYPRNPKCSHLSPRLELFVLYSSRNTVV